MGAKRCSDDDGMMMMMMGGEVVSGSCNAFPREEFLLWKQIPVRIFQPSSKLPLVTAEIQRRPEKVE